MFVESGTPCHQHEAGETRSEEYQRRRLRSRHGRDGYEIRINLRGGIC